LCDVLDEPESDFSSSEKARAEIGLAWQFVEAQTWLNFE
jgi:hypothetical protein